MRMLQRGQNVRNDTERIAKLHRATRREMIAQRFTRDVRHHEKGKAVGRSAVEQRHNIRMLQVGSQPDLIIEILASLASYDVGALHFERDRSAQQLVVREVDDGHAAGANLALYAIAPGQNIRNAYASGAGIRRGRAGGKRCHTVAPGPGGQRLYQRLDIGQQGSITGARALKKTQPGFVGQRCRCFGQGCNNSRVIGRSHPMSVARGARARESVARQRHRNSPSPDACTHNISAHQANRNRRNWTSASTCNSHS